MKDLTDRQFAEAVASNISIAGVIRSLSRALVGTSYRLVRKEVQRLGLDTSHWRGRSHGTSKLSSSLSPEDLASNSSVSTKRVKRLIIKEGLIPYKCSICGCLPKWNNRPLVLRLDHKDGVRNNHTLSNLRFLCPNCDSQTETFCGRNKRAPKPTKCTCGEPSPSGRCIQCAAKDRSNPTKIEWPSVEHLKEMLKDSSYAKVGRSLGVTDNAIRKHLRSRSLVVEGGRL